MKKILFVTYDFPYPPDSGGKTRAFNLLKFAGSTCDISLFSFVRKVPTPQDLKKINEIGIQNIYTVKRNSKKNLKSFLGVFTGKSIFYNLYFDKKIEKRLHEIIDSENIDLVHFESYYTGFYLSTELKKKGILQVLGTENIEHQLYDLYTEKNAALLTKPVLRREVKKIKREELHMIKEADASLAVTRSECEFISKNGGRNCTVIENGVDVEFFAKTKKTTHTTKLLFIGNFSYFPNIDAMQYFYYEIFPMLPKDIMVKVVGKNHKNLGIKDKRIEFIDYVEDIRDVYSDVFAVVSPIRIGGGTNFKILEAMASRTPIIADPGRVPDTGAKSGRDILTASTPEEFADKITLLKENKDIREQIAQNAFEFVKEKYTWQGIGEKLNTLWKKL